MERGVVEAKEYRVLAREQRRLGAASAKDEREAIRTEAKDDRKAIRVEAKKEREAIRAEAKDEREAIRTEAKDEREAIRREIGRLDSKMDNHFRWLMGLMISIVVGMLVIIVRVFLLGLIP